MSVTVSLERLLAYTDHERAKWRAWIAADPSRISIPFQPGGRFPDIGSMLDHVFLVERRHLSRLEGSTPPDSSGVAAGDWKALFEYADLVRADLRKYEADCTEGEAAATIPVTVSTGTVSITKQALATHIVLHEVRHLAQIAFAARLAGHEPPGQHDFFYFTEPA
jgi:uncharacterized damage-inducible protein DinB